MKVRGLNPVPVHYLLEYGVDDLTFDDKTWRQQWEEKRKGMRWDGRRRICQDLFHSDDDDDDGDDDNNDSDNNNKGYDDQSCQQFIKIASWSWRKTGSYRHPH